MFFINFHPDQCRLLTPEDTFAYPRPEAGRCGWPAAADLQVVLTPYDILRLKTHLGLTSTDFLAQYTRQETEPETKLPLVVLDFPRTGDKCPFLEGAACTVFPHRPSTCRLHPLGIACTMQDDRMVEECLLTPGPEAAGPTPAESWTVGAWLTQQELTVLEADLNRQWLTLVLSKTTPECMRPDARLKALFAMVAYDLDKFRRFVFETPFLEIFEIDAKAAEPLKTDDLELLQFGFRYLRMMFGLECTLTISDEVRRNAFPSDPSIANLYLRF